MRNFKLFFLFAFSFSLILQGLQAQSIVDSLVWAKVIENYGLELRPEVVTDDADNIYFISDYQNCAACFIAVDGDTLYQGGDDYNHVFLAKMDQDGHLLNHQLFGGEVSIYQSNLEIDQNDHLLFFLLSGGEIDLMGNPLESELNLVKLDQNLDFIWSFNLKGIDHIPLIRGSKISFTPSNDIIIGGAVRTYSNQNVIVDTIIIPPDTFYVYEELYETLMIGDEAFTVEDENFFVAKISEQGNLIWAETFQNSGPLELGAIHVAPKASMH